jgi:dolichol-phosphate mannosyltransferase
MGIATATLGFIYAAYIFVCAILQYTTPGWAETVLITLFSSGILMIMLGIVGEYLWRTLEESRMRPLYFIEDETTNHE